MHSERKEIIVQIIAPVKEKGRINTNEVVTMFGLHRTATEKYLRAAVE
ncbi:TPA: DUF977 family protein [Enterobacter asburiae]